MYSLRLINISGKNLKDSSEWIFLSSSFFVFLLQLVHCSGQAFPTLSITVGIEESESDFSYCIYVSGVCVTTFSLTQRRSLTAMEPSSGGQAAVTKCRPVVTKVTGDS